MSAKTKSTREAYDGSVTGHVSDNVIDRHVTDTGHSQISSGHEVKTDENARTVVQPRKASYGLVQALISISGYSYSKPPSITVTQRKARFGTRSLVPAASSSFKLLLVAT
ncbi:uncharacterized protein UV8b_04666 [Ustilaginoidea virens]|uniref:Uncharacterized protein n=1 Tax=Ustilaginoidea virens TaxID=1159556 RepID=A0A8E5HRQ0_USTVR|nr:uncharacterized protein UV8b_04666 [Ustilaginoidea virens]QUC20425.1 hypothetical protein UV8b_04666 [Ustilaginoidea virens]